MKKKKRIDNYAKDKIALIKAENKLDRQVLGSGHIDISLMDLIADLKSRLYWKKAR